MILSTLARRQRNYQRDTDLILELHTQAMHVRLQVVNACIVLFLLILVLPSSSLAQERIELQLDNNNGQLAWKKLEGYKVITIYGPFRNNCNRV